MSINDVLPLKAARRCVVANAVFLGPRDTSDLISMILFTFTMRRHLIRLASGPLARLRTICDALSKSTHHHHHHHFISFRLTQFGWLPFADLRVQCLATTQNAEFTWGVRKLRSYLTRLWTEGNENLGLCRRPLVLLNAFGQLSRSRVRH